MASLCSLHGDPGGLLHRLARSWPQRKALNRPSQHMRDNKGTGARGVYSKHRSEHSEHLTILEEDVEKDDADLVRHCDIGIQQDGNNQPHWILDLFPLSIDAHSQILGGGEKETAVR